MADSSSMGKGKGPQRVYYRDSPTPEKAPTVGSTDNDTTPRPEKPEQEERHRECNVIGLHETQTPTGNYKSVSVRRFKGEANFPGTGGEEMMNLHREQSKTSPNIFYPVSGQGDAITVTFFRNVGSSESVPWGIRWGKRRPGGAQS